MKMKMICPLYMSCRQDKDKCVHKTPHKKMEQCNSGCNGEYGESDRWANPDGACPVCILYDGIDFILEEKDFKI